MSKENRVVEKLGLIPFLDKSSVGNFVCIVRFKKQISKKQMGDICSSPAGVPTISDNGL